MSQASKSTAPATNSQKSIPQKQSPVVENTDKKKLSNYQIFMTKSSADFMAKHPDKTPAEIRSLKNQHWASLSKEEKEGWGKVDDEVAPTKMSPPSFGKSEKQPEPQVNRLNLSRAKKSSKPKGKVSGYNIFYRQTAQKIRQEQQGLSPGEVSKVVAETWGLVSNDVKKKYETMAIQENASPALNNNIDENTFTENN